MNQVDCSAETVEREWRRIEADHKLADVQTNEELEAQAESESHEAVESAELLEKHGGAELDKVELLGGMMSSGLTAIINKLCGLDVDREVFDEFSKFTALVVVKHHPNLSVLEIVQRYQLEIKWVWSLCVMLKAIAVAVGAKQEEKEVNPKESSDE